MSSHVTLKVTGGPLTGNEYTYKERTVAIVGRGRDCRPRLPDDEAHRTISRHHCLLDINPPHVRIRDLGSLNGTRVNGRKIGQRKQDESAAEAGRQNSPEHALADGDEIDLAQTRFVIHIQDESVHSGSGSGNREAASADVCRGCGRSHAGVTGDHPGGGVLCPQCRKDPVSALKALFGAARRGEPGLKALHGLKVLKSLGRGAVGAAFLVRRVKTGEQLALKLLLPEMAANQWARESFLREVDNTKRLNHPHVVRLFDAGSYRDLFFYTMEFCNGGNLDDFVNRRGRRIPWLQAARFILQVLDGLDYIHRVEITDVRLRDGGVGMGRGLVHRDLKPANIFLTVSGGKGRAKVADVGVGKAFDMAGLSGHTMTGSVAGSPAFMPRQQVINFKYAKPDVDVWAAAATMYSIITGEYPRDFNVHVDPWRVVLESAAIPIREREPGVPRSLADVIDRALVDRPEILVKSALELKTDILKALKKSG